MKAERRRTGLNRRSNVRTLVRVDELFLISTRSTVGWGGVVVIKIGAAITADYRGNSEACEISSLLLYEMV